MSKAGRIVHSILCSVAVLCAVVLCVSILLTHTRSSGKLRELTLESDRITASWKQINDEKLEVKKALADLENRIRDAEDEISAAQKREKSIVQLQEDIASLRAQIEAFSPAE